MGMSFNGDSKKILSVVCKNNVRLKRYYSYPNDKFIPETLSDFRLLNPMVKLDDSDVQSILHSHESNPRKPENHNTQPKNHFFGWILLMTNTLVDTYLRRYESGFHEAALTHTWEELFKMFPCMMFSRFI